MNDPALEIEIIHSSRKASKRSVIRGRATPRVLHSARGGVSFFRQLLHCLEELRRLPDE